MHQIRKIIEIDRERCDGCGQCVTSCAEGAIEIRSGKAVVVKDSFCDGLGACLGACPQGALAIVEREAEEFDEHAALEHVRRRDTLAAVGRDAAGCGCPGSGLATFAPRQVAAKADGETPSALGHWPVQTRLVPPNAPFLKGAELLVAADCVPVAFAGFHRQLLAGRAVMIGCPKFDDNEAAVTRLAEVFRQAGLAGLTVARMEVPCCRGLSAVVAEAMRRAQAGFPLKEVVITRQGDMVASEPLAAMTVGARP